MRVGAFEINEPVPQLKEPHALAMLRPWVDVGSVGSLTLSRLERHFKALELGKIARPGNFFDFTRYRPMLSTRGGKREITVPNSFIYYGTREDGHDFLFLHLLEPHAFGEDYSESVIELLQHFGVKRYFLIGSMYDAVPHTRPLLVTGSAVNDPDQASGSGNIQRSTYEGPTTITYMIGQEAAKVGIESSSMIVHLPQYAQLEEDFTGAARVLEALGGVYGLPPNLIDSKKGESQYEELSRAVASNPQLQPVIAQLEANYDARSAASGEPAPELPTQVEDFLSEMGERFDLD
jgi:hypothetical protein